ncbi:hypothetical protein B0J14DRAFT_312820 [Halenospora varia]|nr:hypothetical protein B0J14DRAFT_312820 [Halenospora varia]
MASVSSAGDAVPFKAACPLSSGLIILAGIRIYGYYQSTQRRPSQLAISSISFALGVSISGVVFSKAYMRHKGVLLGLLLCSSGVLGLLEVESLLFLFSKLRPQLVRVSFWISAVISLPMAVGFVGSAVQNQDSQSVWVILLFATSGTLYVLLFIGYIILYSHFTGTALRLFLFLCLAAPCLLPLIIAAPFLGRTSSVPSRLVLSAWVFLALSSVCTTRYQLFRTLGMSKLLERSKMQERLDNQPGAQLPFNLAPFSNLPSRPPNHTEEHGNKVEYKGLDEELGIPFGSDPLRQDSMAQLVAPLPVHVHDSNWKG